MEIASWGSESFVATTAMMRTFQNLGLSGALSVEAQETEGAKPTTHIKGEELESLSFDLPLRAPGVNVREKINDWRRYRNEQTPYAFLLAGEKLGDNLWLLTSVSVGEVKIGAQGIVTSAVLSITLQEFVGQAKKQAAAASTKSAGGGKTTAAASTSRKTAKEPTKDEIDALFAAEMAMANQKTNPGGAGTGKRKESYSLG